MIGQSGSVCPGIQFFSISYGAVVVLGQRVSMKTPVQITGQDGSLEPGKQGGFVGAFGNRGVVDIGHLTSWNSSVQIIGQSGSV